MRLLVERKPFLFYLFILFMYVHPNVTAQALYMKHYTSKDGLPSNSIYMIHQGLDGFIWMGADAGLIRFDGKEFKRYNYSNGLIDDVVINVTNDSKNRIWAKPHFMSSSFSVIDKNKIYIHKDTTINKLPYSGQKLTSQIYARKSQVTYLIGDYSLMSINKDNSTAFVQTDYQCIETIFETENGTIFYSDGYNLYSINDTVVTLHQKLVDNTKFEKIHYYNQKLYAISGNTIFIYQYDNNIFHNTKTFKTKYRFNTIHVNQHGVWASKFNSKKLYLYKNSELASTPIEIVLPGLTDHIFTDRDGGTWVIIQEDGVIYIPNPSILTYTENQGLASSSVSVIQPIDSCKIWVGHNSGMIELVSFTEQTMLSKEKFLVEDIFPGYSYMIDIIHRKNKSYFLSRGKFLTRKNNEFKVLHAPNSALKSAQFINDSILSFGSTATHLLNINSNESTLFQTGRVYGQYLDSNKNLWLGGLKGLFKYNLYNDSLPQKKLEQFNLKIRTLASHIHHIYGQVLFTMEYTF